MKKYNTVKENKEFSRIINHQIFVRNANFVIYYDKNTVGHYRFGISVGTKVGNAVVRNKLKRQIRNILDIHKKLYSNELDYIIIVRKNCLNLSFQEMDESLINLIEKINQRRQNTNEKTK